jgi:hypothetical protein
MVHKEYFKAHFREEHLLTTEGRYLHFHRMYTFIAKRRPFGNLKHLEYLTLEEDCANGMLCDASETCTRFKGLEISGSATVDSVSIEYINIIGLLKNAKRKTDIAHI